MLNNREIARYSRQIILPCVGMKGQCKLKDAKVVIVGAGGLGCPVASNLAGAGVGKNLIILNILFKFIINFRNNWNH